jgi:hypothetical protein
MEPIAITEETTIEKLKTSLKDREKANPKDFGIAVLMNDIEETDYEPWQVIVAATTTHVVLIRTDKYNQGQRYQADPNRMKFQWTIPFETFKKALVCDSSLKKAA